MTCARAQGFLAKKKITPKTLVDARQSRYGPAEALTLARKVNEIPVAKGKKVLHFDMRREAPDGDTLLAALLGPSGNLRAPTLRRGSLLLVGFDEPTYRKFLT